LKIDLRRLVHGEHAMKFHRPLVHGDQLSLAGTLLSLEHKSSGRVFTFTIRATVDGRPAFDGTTTYFVRNPPSSDPPAPSTRPAPAQPPPPNWTRTQRVAADQALRYATASGDQNPIHVDAAAARQAGLPGPILHGLCTLALASRDLINHYGDGDPAVLKALSVRWARPVFPDTELKLEVWEAGGGRYKFRTLGPDGKAVLVNGDALLEVSE
jgi:acyl dehydratase